MTARYQALKNGTIPIMRLSAPQSVGYTATAGTVSNAAGVACRVVVTSDAYIAFGPSPTATANDHFIPANTPEYFTLADNGLDKVSAIQVAASGTLHVSTIS